MGYKKGWGSGALALTPLGDVGWRCYWALVDGDQRCCPVHYNAQGSTAPPTKNYPAQNA